MACGVEQEFGAEFRFTENYASIQDFEVGSDKINLSHLDGVESWEDVAPLIEDIGSEYYGDDDGSTYIAESYRLKYGDSVIDITMHAHPTGTSVELSEADFIF